MPRKKKTDAETAKPKVSKELEGLNIKVNSFGEIKTNYDIDKINEFLNKSVDDKKLRDRDDLSENSDT
ncbi:hypothetical protein [Cytophaga aurantiaca]|uniref:hypothetical protein n=1 Tax=Cytophaga aurantiaca TaxID=29530 RepID=UPI000374B6EF|nr:hypothetical protein [Cytophaga aurantiaca]